MNHLDPRSRQRDSLADASAIAPLRAFPRKNNLDSGLVGSNAICGVEAEWSTVGGKEMRLMDLSSIDSAYQELTRGPF